MERGVDRWVMGNFNVQICQMWGVTGMVAGMAVQVSPQKRWLSGQLAVQEWHVMRETWCERLVCELRGNSDAAVTLSKVHHYKHHHIFEAQRSKLHSTMIIFFTVVGTVFTSQTT